MENQNLSFPKLCLGFSALLNLLLLYFLISNNSKDLNWSRRASEEAEAVSSLSCSGHGTAHMDGLISDEATPVCECNACYSGPDCSQFIADCVIDAEGQPIFPGAILETKRANSAITVSGWHRMGYEYYDGSLTSKQLENRIRSLHDFVGNAIADGKYIVFGVGSTQLLNAAVHALSADASSSTTTKVVAAAPYYPVSTYRCNMLYILCGSGERVLFEFGHDTMRFPWKKLSNILSASNRFSLQGRTAENCTFSKDLRASIREFSASGKDRHIKSGNKKKECDTKMQQFSLRNQGTIQIKYSNH